MWSTHFVAADRYLQEKIVRCKNSIIVWKFQEMLKGAGITAFSPTLHIVAWKQEVHVFVLRLLYDAYSSIASS